MVLPFIKPPQPLENQVTEAIQQWIALAEDYELISITTGFVTNKSSDFVPKNTIKVLFQSENQIEDALANFIGFLEMPDEWVNGYSETLTPSTLNGESYEMTIDNNYEIFNFTIWFTF